MKNGKQISAVVLSAGSGKRMGSSIKKQYMEIEKKPVIAYALQVFEDSFVDEVVLVVGEGDQDYCQKEIVDRYHFSKVKKIVTGGKERYHSVYSGLRAIERSDYVYIHDGARPFTSEEMLLRLQDAVEQYEACIAAMPVKDTIKIADEAGMVELTPRRDLVWLVQTPQVFSYSLILHAYETLISQEQALLQQGVQITDDAMVVETLTGKKVKLVEGSYQNIKITTPEDLSIAEGFLKEKKQKKNFF